MRLVSILICVAGPLAAETCPPAADNSLRQAEIMADLKASRGTLEARALSQQLWTLWLEAPDAKAQGLLDQGMAQMAARNLTGAVITLDALIAYCPDYVEGYNQRAYANFLRQDFAAALVDLDHVVSLMPDHVGAVAGRGLTLMGLGRSDEAQEALRAAVALNPWLSERSLLIEPEGTDI